MCAMHTHSYVFTLVHKLHIINIPTVKMSNDSETPHPTQQGFQRQVLGIQGYKDIFSPVTQTCTQGCLGDDPFILVRYRTVHSQYMYSYK